MIKYKVLCVLYPRQPSVNTEMYAVAAILSATSVTIGRWSVGVVRPASTSGNSFPWVMSDMMTNMMTNMMAKVHTVDCLF